MTMECEAPPDGLCPKCRAPLERRERMFHWRGRSFRGLVCGPCNALWEDPTDSFLEGVKAAALEERAAELLLQARREPTRREDPLATDMEVDEASWQRIEDALRNPPAPTPASKRREPFSVGGDIVFGLGSKCIAFRVEPNGDAWVGDTLVGRDLELREALVRFCAGLGDGVPVPNVFTIKTGDPGEPLPDRPPPLPGVLRLVNADGSVAIEAVPTSLTQFMVVTNGQVQSDPRVILMAFRMFVLRAAGEVAASA